MKDWLLAFWKLGWKLVGVFVCYKLLMLFPYPENFVIFMAVGMAWVVIHSKNEEIKELAKQIEELKTIHANEIARFKQAGITE